MAFGVDLYHLPIEILIPWENHRDITGSISPAGNEYHVRLTGTLYCICLYCNFS